MDLERLLEAIGSAGVRDYSLFATESRRLSLGIKDTQAGNAHAPLTLAESAGVNYLLVWDNGTVSPWSTAISLMTVISNSSKIRDSAM